MIFFDTNILIYSTINIHDDKHNQSKQIVEDAINTEEFSISSLVLTEFVFALSKLKTDNKIIKTGVQFFSKFIEHPIDAEIVLDAIDIAFKLNAGTQINDLIHSKYAEKYCSKIITFDKDYKNFQGYFDVEIEILE